MVYQKPDGSYGFNWQQQYEFLLREHPENLEEIVHTKFMVLKHNEPQKADYYEVLDTELRGKINGVWDDNSSFGWQESDEVVKSFIKDKGLCELFSDIPALSSIEEDNELSDLTEEDELIAQYGFSNLEFVCEQEWVSDDLEHYLGEV